ncbi:cyclic AMP-responsive element-binding protein 3-like protein 3-A isoform X2 [Acanthaster planci]|uniref:Cyclic AMP-responsive element-binding protein 3-like protein 3-A isoform X2 n=1 Tax=Acanthaster planci TaxID=133434 RepID=A0A8B7ZDH2_ACAPL|nr:cyclic AMP-responsive element-binding protein 3-like protein 3-A isoform X2 [Acanthaster planci]
MIHGPKIATRVGEEQRLCGTYLGDKEFRSSSKQDLGNIRTVKHLSKMSVAVENLSGRTLSGSEDLDLLFNEKDGILSELTFNNTDEPLLYDQDFPPVSDDIFSNLLNTDFDLSAVPKNSYDQPVASPEHSDSGISDGINSPQYQSDSQSGDSPPRIDELEEVIMDSADMSSYLIGSDEMLMEQTTIDKSDLIESGGFDWDLKLTSTEAKKATLPLTVQDIKTISATTATRTISTTDSSYPKLRLTDEEKRLLAEMNITLPTDMPLTKDEERALKTVRRKIRNKISAMDSRKRKKVYVDNLEQRVQLCTKQNLEMQKKMAKLENENKSLMEQLKKLQALVSKTTTKAAHASTCVMVLLLSFALLIAPSFNPFGKSKDSQMSAGYQPSGVVSRTLKQTDMPTEEPYSISTEPSVMADNQLDEDEPITFGRFAKPSYTKQSEVPSASQEAGDRLNADSNAPSAHDAAASQLSQDPGKPAEVKETSRNQSSTDTRHNNPKLQRQVTKTIQHGDEM